MLLLCLFLPHCIQYIYYLFICSLSLMSGQDHIRAQGPTSHSIAHYMMFMFLFQAFYQDLFEMQSKLSQKCGKSKGHEEIFGELYFGRLIQMKGGNRFEMNVKKIVWKFNVWNVIFGKKTQQQLFDNLLQLLFQFPSSLVKMYCFLSWSQNCFGTMFYSALILRKSRWWLLRWKMMTCKHSGWKNAFWTWEWKRPLYCYFQIHYIYSQCLTEQKFVLHNAYHCSLTFYSSVHISTPQVHVSTSADPVAGMLACSENMFVHNNSKHGRRPTRKSESSDGKICSWTADTYIIIEFHLVSYYFVSFHVATWSWIVPKRESWRLLVHLWVVTMNSATFCEDIFMMITLAWQRRVFTSWAPTDNIIELVIAYYSFISLSLNVVFTVWHPRPIPLSVKEHNLCNAKIAAIQLWLVSLPNK